MKKKIEGNCSSKHSSQERGFSLIEVVIGMALVGIALLGLVQLFTYSVMNNWRSDKITNATFLAQQQIEYLRNFKAEELASLQSPIDEQININNDKIVDYRRITRVQTVGYSWEVRVQVFSGAYTGEDVSDLIQNPKLYKVMADISTVISR